MKIAYNKLVRDNIPSIIENEGRKAIIRKLDKAETITNLERKLAEEVEEYIEDKTVDELADILEVLYALCEINGITREQLEQVRQSKAQERGAFKNGLFLEYVEN